jgi:hypothetical protein
MPEGPLYGPVAVGLVVLFVAAGSLLFVGMLATVMGPFRVGDIRFVAVEPGTRVGLWHPPSASRSHAALPPDRAALWRAMFPPPIELHEAATLEALVAADVALVVPTAPAQLTATELRTLMEHARQGGAVLLSGWVATAGAAPREEALRAMARLLGGERVETVVLAADSVIAAGVRGPLTLGLAPGQQLAVPALRAVPAVRQTPEAAALLWTPRRGGRSHFVSGAALHRAVGKGVLVWLAVGPGDVSEGSRGALATVMQNALRFARRALAHELLAWPGGAPCAAMVAIEVDGSPPDASSRPVPPGHASPKEVSPARASPAPDGGVGPDAPLTAFIARREDAAAAMRMGSLAKLEIAALPDPSMPLFGLAADDQRARIEGALADLARAGVPEVWGLRAPLERADGATVGAAAALGFAYVFGGDVDAFALAPRVVADGRTERDARPLVWIPRTMAGGPGQCAAASLGDLLAELPRVRRAGGLLSVCVPAAAVEGAWELPRALAAELRAQGCWVAQGASLAEWWRRRAAVRTNLTRRGPQRLLIEVSNTGPEPAPGLAVRVYAREPIAHARVTPATIFSAAPVLVHVPGARELDLRLPELGAHASRAYLLDVETAGASPGE